MLRAPQTITLCDEMVVRLKSIQIIRDDPSTCYQYWKLIPSKQLSVNSAQQSYPICYFELVLNFRLKIFQYLRIVTLKGILYFKLPWSSLKFELPEALYEIILEDNIKKLAKYLRATPEACRMVCIMKDKQVLPLA